MLSYCFDYYYSILLLLSSYTDNLDIFTALFIEKLERLLNLLGKECSCDGLYDDEFIDWLALPALLPIICLFLFVDTYFRYCCYR